MLYFSGVINGLSLITTGGGGPIIVGIVLLLVAIMFAVQALAEMVLLIKVSQCTSDVVSIREYAFLVLHFIAVISDSPLML